MMPRAETSSEIVASMKLPPQSGGAFSMDNSLFDNCVSMITNMSSRISSIKNEIASNNSFVSTLHEFDKKIEELGGISRFTNTKVVGDIVTVENVCGLYNNIVTYYEQSSIKASTNVGSVNLDIIKSHLEKMASMADSAVATMRSYGQPPQTCNAVDALPADTIYVYASAGTIDKDSQLVFDQLPYLYTNDVGVVSAYNEAMLCVRNGVEMELTPRATLPVG